MPDYISPLGLRTSEANLATVAQRRRFLSALAALFVLPASGACTSDTTPLSVAAHIWPGYELMFLARREGWLDAGLVRLVGTPSATASMKALSEGAVDAAALTLDETLRVLAEGVALKIVLVFNISSGADKVLARPDLHSLAELAGHRLGVEQSALGALMLHHLLRAGGLSADALKIVPLTVDQHRSAWLEGQVDALITYEPVASELLQGGARVVFDSSAIPDTIFDVLAVREDALQRRSKRAGLQALIGAHFHALTHLRHNPVDAAHRLADRLGGSASRAFDAYRGLILPDEYANHRLLDRGQGRLASAACTLAVVLHEYGHLERMPRIVGHIDPAFLPSPTRRNSA